MDSIIERIEKKCEQAKKQLVLISFERKKKKTDEEYIKPVKYLKGRISW